jgi:hypothetical protein
VSFQIFQTKQILKPKLKSKALVMNMEQGGRREKIGTIKLLMEKILKA